MTRTSDYGRRALLSSLLPDYNDSRLIAERAYSHAWLELKGFDPNEPRDPHSGKWTDTGASGASRVHVAAPGPGGRAWREEVQRAVDDAMARDSSLRKTIIGVGFSSGKAPEGVDAQDWEAAKKRYADVQAATVQTSKGDYILVNDKAGLHPTAMVAPATRSLYGLVTHELGHAWFNAHGITDANLAANLLLDHDVDPQHLRKLSEYAASGPHEGLAEMYATKYTGKDLPSPLSYLFDEIEDSVK